MALAHLPVMAERARENIIDGEEKDLNNLRVWVTPFL
jgi:hypothetical protein